VAQKPIPRVPKSTLKILSQENEGALAQNHLIFCHNTTYNPSQGIRAVSRRYK
jgi:hypothetical protein